MASDLVSVCVFCGALLLGLDLPPPGGLHFEVGAAEDTSARRAPLSPGRDDVSEVTAKSGLVGVGWSRAAREGLGGGTPESEWRVRTAYGPTHEEQVQTPFSVDNTRASGTGHLTSVAAAIRYPISPHDSIEAAFARKAHEATDAVDLGQQNYVLSEERELSARREDAALGWRHRWRALEVAVSARWSDVSSSNRTQAASRDSGGSLYGAGVDFRWRRRRWTLSASAETTTGSLRVEETIRPLFLPRRFDESSRLETYRLGIAYASKSTEVFAQATWDRANLPFVALSVLGSELAAFESGYHPQSRSRLQLWDLVVRQSVTRGFRLKGLVRFSEGDESVTLEDPAGILPRRQIDVRRFGVFGILSPYVQSSPGGPLVTLGLTAEILLPSRSR